MDSTDRRAIHGRRLGHMAMVFFVASMALPCSGIDGPVGIVLTYYSFVGAAVSLFTFSPAALLFVAGTLGNILFVVNYLGFLWSYPDAYRWDGKKPLGRNMFGAACSCGSLGFIASMWDFKIIGPGSAAWVIAPVLLAVAIYWLPLEKPEVRGFEVLPVKVVALEEEAGEDQ